MMLRYKIIKRNGHASLGSIRFDRKSDAIKHMRLSATGSEWTYEDLVTHSIKFYVKREARLVNRF